MQLSNPAAYWKLSAITALAGALVAGGASFALPERYVSTAILRVRPQTPPGATAEQARMIAGDRLRQLQQSVFSRIVLAELIQRPELDLYRADRQRQPLEDIIQNMRTRDVRVQAVNPSAISISFAYDDGKVAQRVVRSLVTKFTEFNITVPVYGLAAPVQLEVLDPASLPERASGPNRMAIAATGLLVGLALGLSIAWLWRRPVHSTPYLKSSLVTALVTGVLAAMVLFALPDRYISTAVLRIVAIDAAGLPSPVTSDAVRQFVQNKGAEVLAHTSFAEVIQSVDLYPRERRRRPLEDIIVDMRRSIRIQPVAFSAAAFRVSFEYTDRYKAQAVVRRLTTKFVEANVAEQRSQYQGPTRPGGSVMEVLDPASLPSSASWPNRALIVLLGFGAGIPLGLVIAVVRRRPPGQPAAMNGYNTAQTSW
jgi:uncharacterized protein involved in exopolysaccharide biosynthesis